MLPQLWSKPGQGPARLRALLVLHAPGPLVVPRARASQPSRPGVAGFGSAPLWRGRVSSLCPSVVSTCRAGWRDEDVLFCQGPDSPQDFLPSHVAEAGCRHVRQPVPAARHELVGARAWPADASERGPFFSLENVL